MRETIYTAPDGERAGAQMTRDPASDAAIRQAVRDAMDEARAQFRRKHTIKPLAEWERFLQAMTNHAAE